MPETIFGQIVIGPPGSGKTTYCDGMSQFLKGLGRNVAVVNLDPANENVPYKADIDVAELIQVCASDFAVRRIFESEFWREFANCSQ